MFASGCVGGFRYRNRGITPDLNGGDIGRGCVNLASGACRNTENVKAAVEAEEEEEKKKRKAAAGAWNGPALPLTTTEQPPIFGRCSARAAAWRVQSPPVPDTIWRGFVGGRAFARARISHVTRALPAM